MRLICGFVHLNGRPAEAARLDAMVEAMTAPGLRPRPARRLDGPAALAMLDFSAPAEEEASVAPALPQGGSEPALPQSGSEPALPQSGSGLTLAADIRLDEPEGIADDQGLLGLLEQRGIAGLPALAGDFAFAAWNPRDQSLLCVRDGMGIRPLFHAFRRQEFFVFASLPRGVHASGLIPRELNPAHLIDEVLFRPVNKGNTLFAGLERLTPGGWLRISAGGIEQGRHWQIDQTATGGRTIAPAEAAAHLSELIDSAVRRRLSATGPVATHLSGGVDSSAIAILAARHLQHRNHAALAYSLSPAPFGNIAFGGDSPYIAPVLAQEANIDWQAVRVTDQAAFVWPRMDRDQLFPADPNHPEGSIFADAAARGARVLLSGWGGDEGASYGHRGVLAEALRRGDWTYLMTELRALAAVRRHSVTRTARAELIPYLLPGPRAMIQRLLRRRPPPSLPRLVADLLHPAERMASRDLSFPAVPTDARHIRFNLLNGPGLPRRAEQWALLGARHGMTAAFPLLDRRVVEFAQSLPSALFLRNGWSRRVFRDAMDNVLPEALRWKPTKWDLNSEGPLYVATQHTLLRQRLAELRCHPAVTAFVNLEAVEQRLLTLPSAAEIAACLDNGTGDSRGAAHAFSLLQVFRLIAFLEQHGPV